MRSGGRIDPRRAGLTLLEVLVSMALGVFVLVAAVTVAADHGRILGRTTGRLDMYQSARATAELIARDLRQAGVGVGYRPDGTFAGLSRGNFAVPGGATFTADDGPLALEWGQGVTDDLGVRLARGEARTVADFDAAQMQVCAGSGLAAGQVASLSSREGLHVKSILVGSVSNAVCGNGVCLNGCERVTFTDDATYVSDPGALGASYAEGGVIGGLAHVVWFVVSGDGRGELRRVSATAASPCASRESGCGEVVARDVETLQVALWQWDEDARAWVDRTGAPGIDDRRRIRVDLELVVRGPADDRGQAQSPVTLALAPGRCVPHPCGGGDRAPRWTFRTSVDVRNAGRMVIR